MRVVRTATRAVRQYGNGERWISATALLLLSLSCAFAQNLDRPGVEILVFDESHQPVPAVHVEIRSGSKTVAQADTGIDGRAEFSALKPGRYDIVVARAGFEPLKKSDLELTAFSSVEFTLAASLARHERVEVKASADAIEQSSSPAEKIAATAAKELPSRPATVSDALPLVPGVVRSPTGDVLISAAAEHRSALIVNSADVTDPATGQFGLTVPIDSVETLNVFQTPFLAEYGRFTAGIVSVETRRGGEEWKWEVNDPFPDFRIRSYHMRGVRDASPRVNAEGPIIRGKLYFSEGLEYEMRKIQVFTLPFPRNQKKKEGVNSFAQLDWVASPKQLVTTTVHIAPQRLGFVNLNYYNPESTVPDASTHNYTTTLAHHWSLFGGILENTFSMTRFDAGVWRRGPADLILAPEGNSGNYFANQSRDASRYGISPVYTFPALNGLGTHTFKIGGNWARSSENGQVSDHPIDIVGSSGQLLKRIEFLFGRPFQTMDDETGFFGQDHWSIFSRLAADLGIRTESQQISHSFRVAPRAGLAWTPFVSTGTVVRAGFGLFYDRVPLNVYSFNHYPKQWISIFDNEGQLAAGPYFFENVLGEANVHIPFVRHSNVPGNFSPRSATGSIAVEQNLSGLLKVRVGYMQNESSGLVVLDRVDPDPVTRLGAYELQGNGVSRYRQLEVTAGLHWKPERELFFSYVRSRARGDLNDFGGYLGSFPTPVIRPDLYGNLAADLPNRFLAWGTVPLPSGFRISPVLEYRNGFPYMVIDAGREYAGMPNAQRFPNFLSLDSRFSKDVKVNAKYTVRLSVSSYNLTNHFNPEALHGNIAERDFGLFFGQRGRHFTADFDVLF